LFLFFSSLNFLSLSKTQLPKCLPPNAVYSKSIYGSPPPPRSPRKNRKQKSVPQSATSPNSQPQHTRISKEWIS
jgi:hypothetical protein